MSQDGNLRSKKQWLLYTYDAFNRPSSQRLATDTSTADQAQRHAAFCNAFDGGTAPALYTGFVDDGFVSGSTTATTVRACRGSHSRTTI